MQDKNEFPVPRQDDKPLWDVWMSSFHYPAIQVALEKGIFEELNQAPLTTAETAEKLGYSYRSMEAMLGLLTSLNFLTKHEGKHYLSPVAQTYLQKDSPFYWGGILNYRTDGHTRELIREMLEKEKNNTPGTEINESWEQGKMDPEKAERFTEAMHSTSAAPAEGLSQRLDLKGHYLLLDVAGGSGSFAMAIASKNTQMRATVFELPEVAPYTDKFIKKLKFESQVSVKGGNMFNADHWPRDYDTHFYSNIFHDWDEKTCRWLAEQSFTTLKKGGKIILNEMMLSDNADSNPTALAFSFKMLISMKGKQYRFAELKSFLEDAGFINISTFPSFGYFSAIIGEKPK